MEILKSAKLETGPRSTGQAVLEMEDWSLIQEQSLVVCLKLLLLAQVKLTSAGTSVYSNSERETKPL